MNQRHFIYRDSAEALELSVQALVADLTRGPVSIREGKVLSVGPALYRRLDCDGRALAYVRARPKKKLVRVDVSGLWIAPRRSQLAVPSSGGALALELRSESDRALAVEYLCAIVETTREVQARREVLHGVPPREALRGRGRQREVAAAGPVPAPASAEADAAGPTTAGVTAQRKSEPVAA